MRSMKAVLLAATLVLGCGSAMGEKNDQTQGQYQAPDQAPQGQYQGPTQAAPQSPTQNAPQAQPRQGDEDQPQAQGPDQNEDAAVESFQWVRGQSHFGIVVEGMTRDLRSFFGAPADSGVLVAHVRRHSMATQAGLRVGDILLDVNGQRIKSADDVLAALAAQPTGRVRINVIREGRRMRLEGMLPNAPQQNEQGPENETL